jgi:hypothetical protein
VYCDGTNNHYYLFGQQITPPSGTYAFTNQGSATVTKQTNGIWSFAYPNHGAASDSVNIYDTAVPSEPYTNIYRFTGVAQSSSTQPAVGVVLRESGTGKLITVGTDAYVGGGFCSVGACILVEEWNSATSFNSTVGSSSTPTGLSGLYLLPITIKVNVASGAGANITISYSPDGGVTYVQLYQAAKTAWFSTDATNIGVYGNNNTNSSTTYLTWLSIN